MTYPRRGLVSLVLEKAGWLFILPLLVGLALILPASVALENGWALSLTGSEVTGQVTGMTITTRSCGSKNASTCTDYNLAFAFEAAGVMTAGTAKVAEATYRALQVKSPVRVRYLATDPAVTEVEFDSTLISGAGLGLITAGFLIGGLWGVTARTRKALRMIGLRERGVAQRVTVTGQVDAKTRINGTAMWRISWRDAAGVAATSRLYRPGDLPPPGSEITIYADPTAKLPSVWERDCGSRAA